MSTQSLERAEHVLSDAVVDDCASGVVKASLRISTDEEISEFEIKHIFEGENGADGYHVTALHWNYAATTSRRQSGESKNETKALDAGGWGKSGGGYWSYPNGHLCLWTWKANPEDQPLYSEIDSLKEQFGDATGDFMVLDRGQSTPRSRGRHPPQLRPRIVRRRYYVALPIDDRDRRSHGSGVGGGATRGDRDVERGRRRGLHGFTKPV